MGKKKLKKIRTVPASTRSQLHQPPQFSSCWAQEAPSNRAITVKVSPTPRAEEWVRV